MKETLEKADKDELVSIASDLENKSRLFKSSLDPDVLPGLNEKEIVALLRTIFSTRRKYNQILLDNPLDQLKEGIMDLLHQEKDIQFRFQNFVSRIKEMDKGVKHEFASELLHFYNPDQYWLWSRWIWDQDKKTGALPLVATEGFDLTGNTVGETYLKVGKGIAFVNAVGEAAEFQFISRTLFGTDVFLSCVYSVYAYTVLRMRMTQEFNKIMPGLTEFSRRLLGVNKMKQVA